MQEARESHLISTSNIRQIQPSNSTGSFFLTETHTVALRILALTEIQLEDWTAGKLGESKLCIRLRNADIKQLQDSLCLEMMLTLSKKLNEKIHKVWT